MGAARPSRQIWDEKNPAVTERRYSTADVRSRARKGEDGRITAGEAGSARTHTGAQWTARPTLTLRLWAGLARGHPGCSALKVGRACQELFRPGEFWSCGIR